MRTEIPVLLYPGVTQNCDTIKNHINKINSFPQFKAICINFGQDTFIYLPKLLEKSCKILKDLKEEIKDGYINFGISQGGILAKATIQYCDEGIYAKGLVTLSSPLMGVSYVPYFNKNNPINLLMNICVFGIFRYFITPCNYFWTNLDIFNYNKRTLISEFNNLVKENKESKRRLLNLERIIMIQSNEDNVVFPKESAHMNYEVFDGLFKKKIIKYEETENYTKDTLGLRNLFENNKLIKCIFQGDHTHYNKFELNKILIPFMDYNNKLDTEFYKNIQNACNFNK